MPSAHQRPLQLIEVTIGLACLIFAWPVTINCNAPFQTCTPTPNAAGEIIRPTSTEPFFVILLENWLQKDFDLAYKTGTSIERPVLLDEDKAASASATPAAETDLVDPSPVEEIIEQ